MIRVTVDLNDGIIAVLEIANRSDLADVSDYDYRFATTRWRGDEPAFGPWLIARGHRRSDGVWPLVARVLALRVAGTEDLSDFADA